MTEAEIRILCECLGDPVRALYRTHFLDEGELDTREGDLTLVFRSGKTVRLTNTPWGYDLSIAFERSGGPFVQTLDAANQAEVNDSEKLVEVCLNDDPDWQPLIGQPLAGVGRLIYTDHQEPCGVSLRFPGNQVVFVYDLSDEVIVQLSTAPSWLEEQQVCSR